MATIGTFTKTENGYNGSIETLSMKATKVTFVPAEKTGEKGPDYRVKAGNVEIGAAWAQTSKKGGNPYLTRASSRPSMPTWSNRTASTFSSGRANPAGPEAARFRWAALACSGGKEITF